MLSALVHLKNVFFGAQIKSNGNDIDVYSPEGEHMVAVRDGLCRSEALGCSHRFTLDPIPREARLYKEVKGKVEKDDEFESRLQARKKFLSREGLVMSMEKMKSEGYTFDVKGNVISSPAPKEVQAN